ncbi:hypothetical protein GC176_18390 [bacterium]|nr:hypothetical protein [bacterium]
MHSCVYVIIGKTGDIETQIAKAMGPFDENLKVIPYKLYLSASTLMAMARHYKIAESDHAALIERMPDWLGDSGGRDRLGLYALCSHNPNGRWDWYEIGGRFNGVISSKRSPRPFAKHCDLALNTAPASRLLNDRDFASKTPFAIVTSHGEWIERSRVESNASGWYVREEPLPAWTRRVRAILRTYSNHRIVCVDAHS